MFIMESMGNKKNWATKEEGELTDDDDDIYDERLMRHPRKISNRENRGTFRYLSSEQSKNYEMGFKRKETRRRTETDNRRSSRNAVDGSIKKHHREHQDYRQTSAPESHTSSKIWAKMKFRASSVKPSSPRHSKSSGPRRNDSPQLYRQRDSNSEGQDELERLEREQKRIQEQLKSLEEEEQNDGLNENDCILESFDERSDIGEDPATGTADSTALNYILEAEKSEDEDIDIQELRRKALATSERHIRLMATEPQVCQPGLPSGDVVVIPDVETDLPEPVVVMVDEEEEFSQTKKLGRIEAKIDSTDGVALSSSSKKKSKRSSKLKKKGQSIGQKKEGTNVKPKVTRIGSKKSKGRKHKKVDSKQEDWIRQCEALRILVFDNPEKALETLQKFASQWNGTEKPIATGTFKDLKRQKQIPVLSDKRAVQKAVERKKIIQEKRKEVKEPEKRSGQLQDNYDEVEMDMDSNAEEEEKDSNFGELHFGDDFNQAMLPVSSYECVSYGDIQPNVHSVPHPPAIPTSTSQQFMIPSGISYDGAVQPPIPPPIPPPPPPPPPQSPIYEEEQPRETSLEKRLFEVQGSRESISKNESNTSLYQEEGLPVYHVYEVNSIDLIHSYTPTAYTGEPVMRSVKETEFQELNDFNRLAIGSSLDEHIERRLRLIRQNQENIVSEPDVVNVNRIMNVFSGKPSQKYVYDHSDRSVSHHLIPLTENSEDMWTNDPREEYHPCKPMIEDKQSLLRLREGYYDFHPEVLSPLLSNQRNHDRTGVNSNDFHQGSKNMGFVFKHDRSLTSPETSYKSDQKTVRKINRSSSPTSRLFSGEPTRNIAGPPCSSAHSRRTLPASLSKHRDMSYSPTYRSTSRDPLFDRAPVRSHNHHHHYSPSSPQREAHRRRSNSSEAVDCYQPEAPPIKRLKQSSPPLYIPTSIRPTSSLQESWVSSLDSHHSSESEEEDLRNKLLAEVIEKRKTVAEGQSSKSTLSGMSPSQDSVLETHTLYMVDLKNEHVLCQKSIPASSLVTQENVSDESEDARLPTVINRLAGQSSKPQSPTELSSRRSASPERCDIQQEQHSQQQSAIKFLDMQYLSMEDSDDLSKSDIDILKAFVSRVQAHALAKSQQPETEEDTEYNNKLVDKPMKDNNHCSTFTAGSTSTVLLKDQLESGTTVSSSSTHNYSNPQISSITSPLNIPLKPVSSTASGTASTDLSDQQFTEPGQDMGSVKPQDADLITSFPVTSINTSDSSDIHCQLPLKIRYLSSPLLQIKQPAISSEPSASPPNTALFEQSYKDVQGASVGTMPKAVSFKIKPKTSSKHYPGPSLRQKSMSPTTHSVLKTSANMKSQSSINTTSSINISTFPQSIQSIQQDTCKVQSQIGELSSRNALETTTNPTADPTGLLTNAVVGVSVTHSTISQSSTAKLAGSIKQQFSNAQHGGSSELLNNHRPNLSSYASQSYISAGQRKYPNTHVLPVHPQVLVPVNSSSESEGEDGHARQATKSKVSTLSLPGGEEQDISVFLNAQGVLAEAQGAASQFLTKQEELLAAQEQSIQKDQKNVKLLVKRAVKFLEAQQQEEEKRELFRAQMLALTHKMKTTEKLVMLLKAEKEKTEKQVQFVTERLLQKKKLYARRAQSVVSLGTKLMGPSYVPRITKPHIVRPTQEKLNLTKAQRIAQEKLKLKEKEKQIAEQLRRLKEAQTAKDTARPQVVPVSDLLKSSKQKWKHQDVIKIDSNAKPDILVKQRRKSLLEMNPSTTPNIPLTPRRLSAGSNVEKENIMSETTIDLKSVDKKVPADLSSAFTMPVGTQLTNFCQLQREKTQRYLESPHQSLVASECTYPSLTAQQKSTTCSKIKLHNNEKKSRHPQVEMLPFHETSHSYTSPLLMFRLYRFNSYFRTKENLSLQSGTYSHKINPSSILCPYDLQGTCVDDSCQQLHPKDYKFSDHELLEDIVSYCPKLAGVSDRVTPEEVKKHIMTFVDNLMSKHKGKMTIDDLCLWLLSQVNEASEKRHPHTISLEPRVWKPQPKEETGLSLDLDHKLTTHGVEAINVDRKVTDKDTIVNEEDVRYFAGDLTELLSLEANIMEDQTNIQLWLKLANKKLHDQYKSPTECLDQALSVLARGLEANRNKPELWLMYLTLYKRHPEVKDFPEYCQTALEYAPSYDLWFLYLECLTSYSDKDAVCMQALQFLCNVARERRSCTLSDVNKNIKIHKTCTTFDSYSGTNDTGSVSDVKKVSEISEKNDDKFVVKTETMKVVSFSDSEDGGDLKGINGKVEEYDDKRKAEIMDGEVEQESLEDINDFDWKKLSHQTLEMVLYKTCISLHTGRMKTALHFLQVVLRLKKTPSFNLNLTNLLTNADLLVLWMTYIHVLEWHQLPQQLYSMTNQNPGRILSKENIFLPWSTKLELHTRVDSLIKLHDKAAKVWEGSKKDEESTGYYVKLIQSQVSLLVSQGRHTEAVTKCQSVLSNKKLVDVWLTMADLCASVQDNKAVKQVFSEALSANRYSSKLMFYQCMFLFKQGEAEVALRNLNKFAMSHFDISSKNLHTYNSTQLYSQLLKQQEAFYLHTIHVIEGLSDLLHKDIYMWLCYSLLLELQGETIDTVETYERSLTHTQNPDELILVWQNYISYLMRSKVPAKEIRDIIIRSIISMPTKFPIPFSSLSSSSSSMWINYHHSNRLIEAWLCVLSPEDSLDFLDMCFSFMPNNIQLLLRAIDLCLELKETRRAYSWCQFVAAQRDRPANLSFWKTAVSLAQVEGTPREVEHMLIGCVETMPLAVSGWKDFLLFEVTRENLVAIQKLLAYCQKLELNIEGFVATLSGS